MREVLFSRRADRDLEGLPDAARRVVIAAIFAFAEGQPNADVRKLEGRTNEWRLRVGWYRVIFRRDDEQNVLAVLRVSPRRDAYR